MTESTDEDTPLEHAAQLRRTSDSFLHRLDRLLELETRKRELPPDQPEFVRLAREIEDAARGLLFVGGEQVELAEAVHYDSKANDLVIDLPIRETPSRRDAVMILAEWRAAERELAAAAMGSPEERKARENVDRLREEYRQFTKPPGS